MEFLDKNVQYYRFYTDGSKGDLHVRSAIYDPQTKFTQSFVLNNICSIFTAEAYAIFEALKAIKHVHSINNCKYFLILTDSLSCIQALKNCKYHYKLNYLIFRIKEIVFKYFNEGIEVSFIWIPSHKGITGNEIVDRTAVEGINSLDVSLVVDIPFTDCHTLIKKDVIDHWEELWKKDQIVKGKWYGSIQKSLPSKPWYSELRVASRDFITTLCRLRFGHSTTPQHLARLKILESGSCSKCQCDICDIEHIIFACPEFSFHRLILASELCDMDLNDTSRRLTDLLDNKQCFLPIYKFIKNTVGKL